MFCDSLSSAQFQRTEADPKFELKKIRKPVQIVYASTGITASTTKVVGDVRAKKEADPAWWDALMAKYLSVVERAGECCGMSRCIANNNKAPRC